MKLSSYILELLCDKKQLKAKQIYERVLTEKKVTYQAVHKLLNHMVKEKVLLKETGFYKPNIAYIIENKQKWERLEGVFLASKPNA